MASSKPIVRQVAWFALVPQMAIFLFIYAVLTGLNVVMPITYCVIIYLILFVGLRFSIPINHRRGIAAFKKENYQLAIESFNKSREFFESHGWIDRWRYLLLLSSSRISYREMALLNIAYCYGQLGKRNKSKEVYEEVLRLFPDSQMAISALNMFYEKSNQSERED